MTKFNKKLLALIAILPIMCFTAPLLSAEVNVPVGHIFAPAGFDSNDNTEIIVTGYLPNLCYKAPKSIVSIKEGKISVALRASHNQAGMGFCADVMVPFVEYVNVGALDKGNYKIAVNEKSSWEKKSNIAIAEASSHSIDEAIYANVGEVVRPDEGSRKVLLRGYNPSDCFELKEIAIIDNGLDTYSVLPKMKQIRAFCPKKMIPFSYEFEVPEKLAADRVLLHVRVMDGRSVNAFFSNKPFNE